MKLSKYNRVFKSPKHGYLLYNSLSNSFVSLDDESYKYLKSLEGKEDIEMSEDMASIQNLVELKILTNSDLDEYYNIKYAVHRKRFASDTLYLTINPTLDCNFKCIYCFEGDSKSVLQMSDTVEHEIITFVKRLKTIKKISVTWFGGEPLMAFNRVKSLTRKMLDIGIEYSADMVTNGYLLKETVINELEELKIGSLQITIDGTKEIHDKRRMLKSGRGTFEKIIENIDALRSYSPITRLGIRVNIDEQNMDDYINIYNYLNDRYNINTDNKVFIYPGFVTGENNCVAGNCLFDRGRKIEFANKLKKEHNVNVINTYPMDFRHECPMRNPFYYVIGPVGEIYKCWNDVGIKDKIVGSLIDKENINEILLTRYAVAGDPFDDPKCKDCFHLPTCDGGCPHIRIANEFESKDEDVCDYIKGNVEEFLEIHYDSFLQEQAKKNNI
ncbi:MAG: radical SAM protein [bacterium]